MITNYSDNNHLVLVGRITSDKRFSHEIYGEKFYVFDVEVPRLSGNSDLIPVTISERLVPTDELTIGKKIMVEGQFRSYNSYEGERNRLVLTVFVKDLQFLEDVEMTEEEAKQDLEGLQTMRNLAKNMAYILKCIKNAEENGIPKPQYEEKIKTNFIR